MKQLLLSCSILSGLVLGYGLYQHYQRSYKKSGSIEAQVKKNERSNGANATTDRDKNVKTASQPIDGNLPNTIKHDTARPQAKPALPMFPVIPGMSNSQLARKLIADPMFQLIPATKTNGLENHIKEIMKRAIWDAVQLEIENKVRPFDKTLTLCTEMRDRLAGITPNRRDLQHQVYETINVDYIRHQLENDTFDEEQIISILQAVMQRIEQLESPIRNEQTKTWVNRILSKVDAGEITAFALLREFFDYFHEKIDLIQLDTANFHLRALAPIIKMQGVEYCREQFEKAYPPGSPLPLLENYLNLNFEGDKVELSNCSTDEQRVKQLHRNMLLQYVWVQHVTHTNQEEIPETFQDEQDIIRQLQRQVRALCRTDYFAMKLRQLYMDVGFSEEYLGKLTADLYEFLLSDIPPSVVDVSEDGKFSMVSVQQDETGGPGVKLLINMVRNHLLQHYPGDGEKFEADEFAEQVKSILFPKEADQVFNLIENRMKGIIALCLDMDNLKKDVSIQQQKDPSWLIVKINGIIQGKLAGYGLSFMTPNFVRFAMGLLNFAERDYEIHKQVYTKVLSDRM